MNGTKAPVIDLGNAPLGASLYEYMIRAVESARAEQSLVTFTFDETEITVIGTTDIELMMRTYQARKDRSEHGKIGPHPAVLRFDQSRARLCNEVADRLRDRITSAHVYVVGEEGWAEESDVLRNPCVTRYALATDFYVKFADGRIILATAQEFNQLLLHS